ncbi:MAG: hypothetical protein HY721_16565 [Planctomycetes bacterium]|nr:hypothetical protein [Planctomycetota bacterium]
MAPEIAEAEALLPPAQRDGSGIGVNYADAYLKALNVELEDGRKVACKRKGLKVVLEIGAARGEGLLRRLEHGPDPRAILRKALEEAARGAGAAFSVEGGTMYLDL